MAEEDSLDYLRAELEALALEEQALRRKDEKLKLRDQIAAKRKARQELTRERSHPQEGRTSVFASKDLPQLPNDNSQTKTLLDDLLMQATPNLDQPLSVPWFEHPNPSALPQQEQASSNATEMFLNQEQSPRVRNHC